MKNLRILLLLFAIIFIGCSDDEHELIIPCEENVHFVIVKDGQTHFAGKVIPVAGSTLTYDWFDPCDDMWSGRVSLAHIRDFEKWKEGN